MRTDTKALLDDLKLNPRETYDDVVRRLAEAAYDDEPLTPDEIEAMEEGIADLKAGRSRSLDEVMKELGDDRMMKKTKNQDEESVIACIRSDYRAGHKRIWPKFLLTIVSISSVR